MLLSLSLVQSIPKRPRNMNTVRTLSCFIMVNFRSLSHLSFAITLVIPVQSNGATMQSILVHVWRETTVNVEVTTKQSMMKPPRTIEQELQCTCIDVAVLKWDVINNLRLFCSWSVSSRVFLELSNDGLPIEYHLHTWQMSPKFSFWSNRYTCKIRNIHDKNLKNNPVLPPPSKTDSWWYCTHDKDATEGVFPLAR